MLRQGDIYRFLHDRVRQAAYSLIAAERAAADPPAHRPAAARAAGRRIRPRRRCSRWPTSSNRAAACWSTSRERIELGRPEPGGRPQGPLGRRVRRGAELRRHRRRPAARVHAWPSDPALTSALLLRAGRGGAGQRPPARGRAPAARRCCRGRRAGCSRPASIGCWSTSTPAGASRPRPSRAPAAAWRCTTGRCRADPRPEQVEAAEAGACGRQLRGARDRRPRDRCRCCPTPTSRRRSTC